MRGTRRLVSRSNDALRRGLSTSLVLQEVGTFDPHRRAVLVLQPSWHSRTMMCNSTRPRTRASSGQRLGGTTQRTFWSGWQWCTRFKHNLLGSGAPRPLGRE